MATRMQQRRGTASQWTTANPILATGEIGFETDTNQFKIGDGTNHWADLSYFKNLEDLGGSLDDYLLVDQVGTAGFAASLDVNGYIPVEQLGNIVGDAPTILNTLEELAGALQDADGLVQSKINTHAADEVEARETYVTNSIDTAIDLITTDLTNAYEDAISSAIVTEAANRDDAIDAAISTEVLARDAAIDDAITVEIQNRDQAIDDAINAEALDRDAAIGDAVSSVTGTLQGYADDAALAAQGAAETSAQGYVDAHNTDTTNIHGITDTANLVYHSALDSGLSAKQDKVTGVSDTEIGYLDGVTSAIQTQIDAKLASTTASSTYAPLASPALTGVPTAPTATAGTSTTQVATTAFVGTAVADLVASAPAALNTLDELAAALGDDVNFATTVTNSIATKAPVNGPTFTGLTTVSASGIAFTDGTQVKAGVPSLTTINQQAGAYTTVLEDRDKLVEVSSGSGVTVTIPANASVAYPVGTSIDILQTGSGQVTIAGSGGVTVNATPGLKLRTQWSSATLFKRATDTWVVFGDLSA